MLLWSSFPLFLISFFSYRVETWLTKSPTLLMLSVGLFTYSNTFNVSVRNILRSLSYTCLCSSDERCLKLFKSLKSIGISSQCHEVLSTLIISFCFAPSTYLTTKSSISSSAFATSGSNSFKASTTFLIYRAFTLSRLVNACSLSLVFRYSFFRF